VIACMFSSSKSWELQQHPRLWHSRAGGGAVHSIRSGHRLERHAQFDVVCPVESNFDRSGIVSYFCGAPFTFPARRCARAVCVGWVGWIRECRRG
jgi:hypothetical protein